MPFSAPVLAILSVIGVTLLSLLGVVLFFFDERAMKVMLLYFVSFSTGAMLGDVFINILPEMAEQPETFGRGTIIVLVGILFAFAVEKLIHWRHCHVLPGHNCCGGHTAHHHHHHSVGIMSTIGETFHNFIDGIIIAASFLSSIPLGISTTLAVVFHEIPHEIGNVAVLLHSGFSKRKAILYNVLAATPGLLGALLVLAVGSSFGDTITYMLPFAAGNLLYIAGSDLIPELHKETGLGRGVLQLLAIALGMALMYALLGLE